MKTEALFCLCFYVRLLCMYWSMSALSTLSHIIRNDLERYKGRVLFLNARYDSDIYNIPDTEFISQQYFKPYADELQQKGAVVAAKLQIQGAEPSFDAVVCLMPKNMVEARYGAAMGLRSLKKGGFFVCAADNKAGGTRIQSMMRDFGLSDIQIESKNKARCGVGVADVLNEQAMQEALDAGGVRPVLDNRFLSQSGVFGWNKIDKGSELLTQFIPNTLKGKGADFGCGYGYLSDYVLSHCPKVKHIYAIDADRRAVDLCAKNLEQYEQGKTTLWRDLTTPQIEAKNLDFIIMNPPFHEGRDANTDIGVQFIETARSVLRLGGALYMVANSHLPYEKILAQKFETVRNVHEGQGFKIFVAEC